MFLIRDMIILIAFIDSIVLWYKQNSNVDFLVDLLMNLSLVLFTVIYKPVSGFRRFVLLLIYLIIILRFILLLVNKYI
ncbi:hypothetical protein G653_02724 [Candidatus Liberibacter americanus PW_SP]|nr:hypothetical protein G653_02724 [Candidatus Liberibacter americanus PW_SP]